MSLTSVLTDVRNQELRDKFKTVFPRPVIDIKGKLLAPPITKNYSIVGQAFDYILRFKLERKHSSIAVSTDTWIADISYQRLILLISLTDNETIMIGHHKDIPKNRLEFHEMIKREYQEAKANYVRFKLNGRMNDHLIKSALFLARLDVLKRANMIDPNLGNEVDDDIEDVKRLIALIKSSHFAPKVHCIINPHFKEGSLLVGGADADLIIDDTLIEIKVTKDLKVKREQLNQLIGYYILSLIGGVNGDLNLKPIHAIGIYFARHGVLWKIPIAELASKKEISKFKKWFIDYMKGNNC